jgi:hypothetical protein
MGRIEHGRLGGQTGADPERAVIGRLEFIYYDREPGTGLFFRRAKSARLSRTC